MWPMSDRTALFVRMPVDLVAAVDDLVRETGRTKQAIVTDFVAHGLAGPGQGGPPAGASEPPEVCDLEQIAALLRVQPDDVVERVAADDLPGRFIGGEWRFSRTAVLRWLDGADRHDRAGRTDHVDRPRPGFAP